MKTFFALLCIFAAFALVAAQIPPPGPDGISINQTLDVWPTDTKNGLQGYFFREPLNVQPSPPMDGSSWDYYLALTIHFDDLSEKFYIDFDATSDKQVDYYVKGEHALTSTVVLMDPSSANPGEGKNGWVPNGLRCGIFAGTIYSEVPVDHVIVTFVPTGSITTPDNSSVCWEDEGDDWYDGEGYEEDDGVRLFLISFFSTFGILLFVFSLCLCCFACIRSCRYKCRARRCARRAARKAVQAELKATTQLAPATVETPAPVQEQVFTAPSFYPEFPQYPQYSMLAAAPQQYYSDQPQVQYVAFHPMMFQGYPAVQPTNQQ